MVAWINENAFLFAGIVAVIVIGVIVVIFQARKRKSNKEANIEKAMREEAVKARAGKPKPETPVEQAMAELVEIWPSLEEGQREMTAAVWLRQERGPQIIALLGEDNNAEIALTYLWPWLQNDDLRRRLVESLRHETPRAAASVSALMPKIDNVLMVPLLLTALLNSHKYLAARAGEALAACGKPGARAMEALFAAGNGKTKETLLQVFAQMPAESCSAVLLSEALRDQDPAVCCAAVAAVTAWQLPEGINLLKPLCQDQDLSVRAAVAAALGEFGGEEARIALEAIDAGGEWAVEAAVQTALRQFQTEEAEEDSEIDREAATEEDMPEPVAN